MEIVQLGVLEGPNDYSQEAVLTVDLRQREWGGAHRHRMSAFHELVVTMLRAVRDPGSLQEGSRPMAPPWQRSVEELLAYTIASLHRAADIEVESKAVPVGGEQRRIIVRPAGSRATRWAVEFTVEAFRDFSAGRAIDIQSGIAEVRRLAAESQRIAHAPFL